jgi:penicillin-binding protein 2
MPTDWQDLSLFNTLPAVVDPRRRLRWCVGVFLALLLVLWFRAAQLQVSQATSFLEAALRPVHREKQLPAPRGKILARDGTVLACDHVVNGVAVDYRWLEEPPRQAWLEQLARKRLPKDQRRNAARLAAEVAKLCCERDELHKRLAALCCIDFVQWESRARRVQDRVERIADNARRRMEVVRAAIPARADVSWSDRFLSALHEILAPARDAVPATLIVAEELSDHVLAEDIPTAAVAEIQSHADKYPGTRIVQLTRRSYPHGELAAHVVGYLGSSDAIVGGVIGIEQRCEIQLHGRSGTAIDTLDHAGHVTQTTHSCEASAGGNVTLTIDVHLQQTAEELLDSALKRAAMQYENRKPSGGAIVVMDVHSGEILALASAPRFAPAAFAGDDSARREALLADKASPLFHRAIQMALPPGSIFKAVTAAALLESAELDPASSFYCQGYLDRPDQQRCAIYVRHGTGHGDLTLADALAENCNVYFFHHAESLPPDALADWSLRFGFGQQTGINLSGEAHGMVRSPEMIKKLTGHRWYTADAQAMAIGQGSLTATPLQVARMMAAVANGGLLITPHVQKGDCPAHPIPGLTYSSLAAIRAGLLKAVAGKDGSAHDTLYLDQVSIAGATGTVAKGDDQPDHAWFAGYVPADKPRYAIVVVLERAGDASTAACPVAKQLVVKMLETRMLEETGR